MTRVGGKDNNSINNNKSFCVRIQVLDALPVCDEERACADAQVQAVQDENCDPNTGDASSTEVGKLSE